MAAIPYLIESDAEVEGDLTAKTVKADTVVTDALSLQKLTVNVIDAPPTPGFIRMDSPVAFPKGLGIGGNRAPGAGPQTPLVLMQNADQSLQAAILRLHHTNQPARLASGILFEAGYGAAGATVFRVRTMHADNDTNAVVEIPDADYGPNGAPVLHIGGNTNERKRRDVMAREWRIFAATQQDELWDPATNERFPGAIQFSTQRGDPLALMAVTKDAEPYTRDTQYYFLDPNNEGPEILRQYTTVPDDLADSSLYLTPSRWNRSRLPRLIYTHRPGYVHGASPIPSSSPELEIVWPSFSRFKTVLGEGTNKAEALGHIIALSDHLVQFRYKDSDGEDCEENGVIENGILLDKADARYIDGDRATQQGSVNTLTLHGDLVASVALMAQQIEELGTANVQLGVELGKERRAREELESKVARLTEIVESLAGEE